MLYLFWIISFLLCVIFSFSKKRKITKRIVLIVVFIFLFVMLGWARGSNDIEVGINRYNNYQLFQSYTEIGYDFIINSAHNMGLNYRQFFIISAFLEILSLVWFIDRNTKNSPIVLGMFLIWPMVGYLPLTRSLAAFVFVLIAIDVLLHKPRHYILIYLGLIIIATTIHFSSIFFLLYLVLEYLDLKKVTILILAGFALLYFATGIRLFSSLIVQFVGEKRLEIVLSTTNASGMLGRLVVVALFIGEFFFIYYYLKKFFRLDMNDKQSELFYKMNILSFIYIPLILNYGVGFGRFPTMLSVINYCFMVNKISEIRNQKKRIQVYAVLGLFVIGSLLLNIRNAEYRELVVYPLFENNELFY